MTPVDLLAACVLDAVVGDPRGIPHPVRMIGHVALRYETLVRRRCSEPTGLRAAGIVLALGLPTLAFLAGWVLIAAGAGIHEWVGRGVTIALASTTLAWRDLIDHVNTVAKALQGGSLNQARQAVGLIVGRDTDQLSDREVIRATVETIAESASDGVIAPLIYLAVGGPPLALAYKAVSTLDSMVGHHDGGYRDFGWASARLDDLANWIPARLTAWLIAIGGGIVFLGTRPVWRSGVILSRDGHKHASPNSGRPEAAMAGALGVQLGGSNRYAGLPVERPLLGDEEESLSVKHVQHAARIMTVAYLIAILAALGALCR